MPSLRLRERVVAKAVAAVLMPMVAFVWWELFRLMIDPNRMSIQSMGFPYAALVLIMLTLAIWASLGIIIWRPARFSEGAFVCPRELIPFFGLPKRVPYDDVSDVSLTKQAGDQKVVARTRSGRPVTFLLDDLDGTVMQRVNSIGAKYGFEVHVNRPQAQER